MRQKSSRFGGFVIVLTGLVSLSGCQAIYDDTKGWANRLEASVLKAAEDLSKGEAPPSTQDSSLEWVAEDSERHGTVDSGVIDQTAAGMVAGAEPAAGPEADESTSAATPGPHLKEAPVTPAGAAIADPTGPAGVSDTVPAANPAPVSTAAIDPTGPTGPDSGSNSAQKTAPAAPLRKPARAAADTPAAAAAKPEDRDEKAGDLVAHLSSLRSKEAANKEWQSLKKAFPAELGRFGPAITKTEIAKRGTFYRVLAGPLASKKAAQDLCAALKAKKQYCQVMKAPKSAAGQPPEGDGKNSSVRPVT
ncbi:SPOR domain-containing protein [Pelagibius sp.]|uniref:SPOR domain-containing protein n=1 Tax=Pelagibius sp. TaxID=1931238 RepID=UPI002621D670|nr:SPOR domain-containing protein [Pelagibius sp.]